MNPDSLLGVQKRSQLFCGSLKGGICLCLQGDVLHLTSRRKILLFLFLLNGWEEDRMRREDEL